jgi:hypothetical protein
MKIEAGKYYRTRDGQKVGPAERNDGIKIVWNIPIDGRFLGYLRDGTLCINNPDYEIISEWSDDLNTFIHSDGRVIDLTDIKIPFGLLDEETQGALKAHGGPYERFCTNGKWQEWVVQWDLNAAIRVRPHPKVEAVTETRWAHLCKEGRVALYSGSAFNGRGTQGTLTTTLQDGKPIKAVWEADQ